MLAGLPNDPQPTQLILILFAIHAYSDLIDHTKFQTCSLTRISPSLPSSRLLCPLLCLPQLGTENLHVVPHLHFRLIWLYSDPQRVALLPINTLSQRDAS